MQIKSVKVMSTEDSKAEGLNTVGDWINWAATAFEKANLYYGHGTDNAWDDAVYLVLVQLGLPIDADDSILQAPVEMNKRAQLRRLIERRIKERVPVAYLNKTAYFAGLEFYVDERVLIPRSPLAELILQGFAPWIKRERIRHILDMGTGSGCLAIACAYALPEASVDAVDISADALEVCKINIFKHQMANRVTPIQSDLFKQLAGKRYDIIVSNPPYVGDQEMEELPEEYRAEPDIALRAAGGGDAIATEIISQAADYLNPGGILIVEVGNSAPLITERFAHLPFVWLEFSSGESETLLITREQLEGD